MIQKFENNGVFRPTPRVSRTITTKTHKYQGEGILLGPGKRILRALCVLPDGRESNIVTVKKKLYIL